MRDFNFEEAGINDGSINGNYKTKDSLNGTIAYANTALGQVILATRYDPDYDLTPSINLLAGTYLWGC